jgi:acetyl esterase/lipase
MTPNNPFNHLIQRSRLARPAALAALLLVLLAAVACGGATAGTGGESEPAAVEATAAPVEALAEEPTAATEPTVEPATALRERPAGGVMPGGGGAATTATPVAQDVAYATASETQKLDLYLPEGDGPFPVVISVHGGGFMMGDKADAMGTTGFDQLLAEGYAVAAVNYRLSGEAEFPAAIDDVKAATRWLRANAAEYNLDTDNFGAWGASAGGNLVALLGTSCGAADIEGADLGNADQSSCVQAVVDWFGPTDFLQMDAQFAGTSCPQTHDAADSPESQYLGAPVQDVPELAAQANPITYVTAEAPPFLIQHGTADCNVPPQQSQLLYDALTAAGVDATLNLLDGAGHGGAEFSDAANMQLVVDFLNTNLK